MTAQPIAEPATAVVEQLRVQRREARRSRHRHQVVPADPADQPLDLALVVALAGTAEPVGEQVVRLQLAEHPRPLPRPVAQNPRYGNLGVVVQDRVRHLAEEAERRGVARTERLRRLRRIGLHEAGVAVRQVHRKEVDLPFHPADLRQRLAKVDLRMPRIMAQRHEHLALPQPALVHIVLHDRQPAGVAVLVPKPLEDPLRGVPLLRLTALILLQDLVDDPDERVQLRSRRRLAAPIPGRHRETPSSWLPSAGRSRTVAPPRDGSTPRSAPHSEPVHRAPRPSSPALCQSAKSYPLPDFYSGATGQSGRFTEGFCLRRLQARQLLHQSSAQ